MQFIELSGKALQRVVSDDELHPDELARLGVNDESVLRSQSAGRHRTPPPRPLGRDRRPAGRIRGTDQTRNGTQLGVKTRN